MKHITFIILFIFSTIDANELINKSFSFNSHHSTFKILSDSLYYIISKSSNKLYYLSLDYSKNLDTLNYIETGNIFDSPNEES
jgi:hypothetical protein